MYYYVIYGIRVVSNIIIPSLNENNSVNTALKPLNLHVEYTHFESDERVVQEINDEVFEINCNGIAKYIIDIGKQRINCLAHNYEAFFSTFFNIPFSVYALYMETVILHTCALLSDNGELICLVGERGAGKSTLSTILDGRGFRLYCDDTLSIEENGSSYRGHNYIKFTKEAIDRLHPINVQLINRYNAAGKQYGIINTNESITRVKAIIKIVRSSELGVSKLVHVSDLSLKRAIFYDNIVGIEFFEDALINMARCINMPQNVDYYLLYVPNTLSELIFQINDIAGEIANAITESEDLK